MVAGFLVGERIPGVDPFNITNFTWIIAGFAILIAKSVRVSDWPRRDFLLGRVRCRSVTELHSVTEIGPQDIIMLFLSTQAKNKLTTCGPFNGPFRNAAPSGFSIDVKPELQTLMACGLVPVKVTTLEGPHLVFLDLVPGTGRLTTIDHLHRSVSGREVLACAIPPDPADSVDLTPRASPNTAWIKVLGIYGSQEE
ncbi:hypothetical protein VTG60DRAFT_716 [Thermothelomyces hinnuleus]